jgi:peroxiredoxin
MRLLRATYIADACCCKASLLLVMPDGTRLWIASALDWRRLLVALPILTLLALVVYLLVRDDNASAAPNATLLETPPVGEAEAGVTKGRAARDFEAVTNERTTIRLSDYRGTPVVVNFWATWCTSCLAEMPDLRDVQRDFGSDQIAVLALNSGEHPEDASDFIEQLAAPEFAYAFDPSLAITDAYGIVGLSHSVFVDAGGVIRATYVGQMTPDLMREYVQAAISATTAAEAPFRLRLPGAVEARTSAFVIEEDADDTVSVLSRRLRCDDSFCASSALAAVRDVDGVVRVDAEPAADPPTVTIVFDPAILTHRTAAEALAGAVADLDDPLYEHEITIAAE